MIDKVKGSSGKEYKIEIGYCKDCVFVAKDGTCDVDRFSQEFPDDSCKDVAGEYIFKEEQYLKNDMQ